MSRVDPETGAVAAVVVGGSGGLFAPRALGFGPNGNLFVSSASGEVNIRDLLDKWVGAG